jgi:hypothetical protein
MHYFYTGVDAKILLLHWEETPKTCFIGFPPNKCSKFLLLFLKSFCCGKEALSYKKVIHRKKEK